MTTSTVITPAPSPSQGPKDAELAAQFDAANAPKGAQPNAPGTPAPAAEKPQRPEYIPEKFWDAEKGEVRAEALAKSYTELEKSKSKPTDQTQQQPPPADPAQAQQQLQSKGLEFSKFETEFAKDGKLSDASIAELEKAGITKGTVDAYIAGQQAVAEKFVAELHGVTEGADNFKAMQEWAAQNATAADLAAYNEAVTGDAAKAKLAVQGLYAKYTGATGSPAARRIEGDRNSEGDIYTSWEQITADQGTAKYRSDPAERQRVYDKLARSDVK